MLSGSYLNSKKIDVSDSYAIWALSGGYLTSSPARCHR
jgi:hypothetical protein